MRTPDMSIPGRQKPLFSPNLTNLSILFMLIWSWFYVDATDKNDWWLENILVIIFLPLLWIRRKKIMFTPLALSCIFLFLLLHIYGARMAYTQNEFGELLQQRFHLQRNPYDRIVHFSFGLFGVLPFIELIYNKLRLNKYAIILIANMAILCLAAIFELLEWAVASTTDSATGETYVATQGDPWDAQKDIVLAVAGAALASIIISRCKTRWQVKQFQREN